MARSRGSHIVALSGSMGDLECYRRVKLLVLDLQTADGRRLAVHRHEPTEPAVTGLDMASAVVVQQTFYCHGIREWWRGPRRSCTIDIVTWIRTDHDAPVPFDNVRQQ